MKKTYPAPFAPSTLKRTKILATVGPETHSYQAIYDLILAGANGLRLNFSHGTNEERDVQIAWIRKASEELNKPVAIYQDLQGPKIRLGEIDNNHMDVKEGDELHLIYGATHDGNIVPTQYDLSNKVKPGERVYIFDGRVKTIATSVDPAAKKVTVKVQNDGVLMSRKGLNLPDTDFSGDIMTEKDYRDIDYGATQDIDYVGLSFVHRAHDIELLREYLVEKGSEAKIIAKIETKTAIEADELEKIVKVSDAVMVARGDLAVEVGAEIVPVVQRQIIGLCQTHKKISIVATQMMSSMVHSPEPTRAEVSDVSHAVVAGADCVMLSDETAMGKYPIETVKSMKRVILYTQSNTPIQPLGKPEDLQTHSAAIGEAAVTLALQLGVDAIIAETKSGETAQNISAHRAALPILAVTSIPRVAQQMTLLYGVKSFLHDDTERAGMELVDELVADGFLGSPATYVFVSGRQPGVGGLTDTIRVRTIS